MKADILSEKFIVAIGNDEAMRLLAGEEVGDRINPINPEAKIIFKPYEELFPEYDPVPESKFMSEEYFRRVGAVKSVVECDQSWDCKVYVPPEVLMDAFCGAEGLTVEDVNFTSGEHAAEMRDIFPSGGVTIRFDNGIGDSEFFERTRL